jgi:hypothetical protein
VDQAAGAGRSEPELAHLPLAPASGNLFDDGLRSRPAGRLSICAWPERAYRIGHPDTKLRLSGYYLPIGDAGLIDRVNAALEGMLEDGEAESLAVAAHMTYLPPRQPYVLDGFRIGDLAKFE